MILKKKTREMNRNRHRRWRQRQQDISNRLNRRRNRRQNRYDSRGRLIKKNTSKYSNTLYGNFKYFIEHNNSSRSMTNYLLDIIINKKIPIKRGITKKIVTFF